MQSFLTNDFPTASFTKSLNFFTYQCGLFVNSDSEGGSTLYGQLAFGLSCSFGLFCIVAQPQATLSIKVEDSLPGPSKKTHIEGPATYLLVHGLVSLRDVHPVNSPISER